MPPRIFVPLFHWLVLGTIWELSLPKPYMDGGVPVLGCNIGGLKQYHKHGAVPPAVDDVWRFNFSRVQVEGEHALDLCIAPGLLFSGSEQSAAATKEWSATDRIYAVVTHATTLAYPPAGPVLIVLSKPAPTRHRRKRAQRYRTAS